MPARRSRFGRHSLRVSSVVSAFGMVVRSGTRVVTRSARWPCRGPLDAAVMAKGTPLLLSDRERHRIEGLVPRLDDEHELGSVGRAPGRVVARRRVGPVRVLLPVFIPR